MDDIASAIDDSGATVILGHSRGIPRSEVGHNAPLEFTPRRRSGHWTVGNTIFGSAIDAGCPTAIRSPPSQIGPADLKKVQPLSTDALRKLKKATEDAERQKAAARAVAEAQVAKKATEAAVTNPLEGQPAVKSVAKGFYVPKRGLGIRIVSKDGKSEVVVRPQSVPGSSAGRAQAKEEAKVEAAPAPTEVATKTEPKAASVASRTSGSAHRHVRIVGKNGEEAFVELPFIQPASKPTSHVYMPASGEWDKSEQEKEDKALRDRKAAEAAKALRAEREQQEKEDKALRDRKAAEAAKALRAERERQQKQEKEARERQAKAAASLLMAGGLSGSRKTSSHVQAPSFHVAKSASSKSASVINGAFIETSKAPSKASSRTMTPPPTQQAASIRAASHASTQRAKTVSIAGWQSVSNKAGGSQRQASNNDWQYVPSRAAEPVPVSRAVNARQVSEHAAQQSRTSSIADWQEVGAGIIPARRADSGTSSPAPQPYRAQHPPSLQRKKAETPPSRALSISSSEISRKIAGIQQWNHATPTVHSAVPATSVRSPLAIQTQHLKNASRDTIFAGEGWISPHPLSRAPTEFESPPQDKISIQGATLTYQDWKQLQEHTTDGDGRRNFSRTSSNVKSIAGGQWAQRDLPASLGGNESGSGDRQGGWASSGGAGQWDNYHVPTVVSEHSHKSTSQVSRVRSVRTTGQKSAIPSTQGSWNQSPPQPGFWSEPQMDGPGDTRPGYGWAAASQPLGGTWREPEGAESAVVFGNGSEKEGSETHLHMPWDKVTETGSQAGAGW